ncbi:LysR family transcriptional regulator [Agrococcus versicolor]|uniref:LysR family transcriptional regulator n=1 Tax=Agrococcus versicolor TaxID=501482 RepID=A0ABN3ASB1_9MICO
MLELRRLRLLLELSQRGTIAAVAAALSYSPSTVSQQLALLEREAGAALTEPDGRRLRLTDAGRLLAEHAARALALDEEARVAVASASTTAVVRIAVMPTAAEMLVPPALSLLAGRHPGLRVTMTELPPETALDELAARAFDVVVAEQYPGHARPLRDGIDRSPLGHDPIRIAVPPDDRATSIADLADRAWVLEPEGTAVRAWATQQCRAAGFEPDVRFEATDLAAHARLVAAGHAVALLPDLALAAGTLGMRLLDLPGTPVREVFAATRTASRGDEAVHLVRGALGAVFAALPTPGSARSTPP